MATTPEKIETPTKTLSENPEKITGAPSSEPEINRDRVSDDRENHAVDEKGSSESDSIIESETLDGESASSGSQSNIRLENRKDFEGLLANNGATNCDNRDEQPLANNGGENTLFRVGDFVWGESKGRQPWFPGRVRDHESAGRILVAFYDGSSSSCSLSQLVPFTENFSEMSRVGNSKGFLKAVSRAVSEVSRVVELEMTCKCVAKEKGDGVGVGDFGRLSIQKYEPSKEVLDKLRKLAKGDFVGCVLEIAVLKSRLSAFYYLKGGFTLPVYDDPVHIEGLEDEDGDIVSGGIKSDFSVRNAGPMEEEWLPSDAKVSRKRKEKSVSELIGLEGADFNNCKRSNSNVELEGSNNRGATLTSRKRKAEKIAGTTLGKPREIEVSDDDENIHGEGNEDLGAVSSPRERRKSKYLSPPYTNLTSKIIGKSSLKMESSIEEKTPNVPKSSPPLERPDMSVNELLLDLQFAAVNPFYLIKNGSLDTVLAFTSALRSSTFLHGADYKMYNECPVEINVEVETLPPHLIPAASDEMDSSQSTDGLISDARLIGRKVEIMTGVLENQHSKFSADDKSWLKDEMKALRERVERVSEKVRAITEQNRAEL